MPNPEDSIEIDYENEQGLGPTPLLIRCENNSSKSHEIAKRSAQNGSLTEPQTISKPLRCFEEDSIPDGRGTTGTSEKKRHAFEEIDAQMPFGSCNISGSGISYYQSPPVIMNMVQNGI